ncbi:MAG TPA: Ig-like domain-containing protein, partial [Cyclobacteriaceae bacterium]
MRHNRIFIFILICGLIQQCAKQTAPTGGPKDTTPPVLINSTPSNEQVNFKDTELQLSFNELIQLNNPREQIIITPSIGKKFEATARKNKVTLVFNSELQDSTTYSINFRESIEDLTEKNPAIAKLAFSTGSYIDSLFIAGTTTDILSGSPIANYTVAVIPESDTFNIFKHSASWITLTDKRGKFLIENLKPGNYFIYAFDDKNRNLIV